MRTMERQKRFQINRIYPGLSSGEAQLLGTLDRYPEGITVSALAEELGMPMPAVSRMMRGMESKGLIERKVRPADRRNVIVTITAKGKAVGETIRRRLHQMFAEALSAVGQEDIERMLAIWNMIMDRMEALIEQSKIEALEDTE